MNKHNVISVQLASDLILIEIIPELLLGHKQFLSHIKGGKGESLPNYEKVFCTYLHGNEDVFSYFLWLIIHCLAKGFIHRPELGKLSKPLEHM